jgi:hypothetical protein
LWLKPPDEPLLEWLDPLELDEVRDPELVPPPVLKLLLRFTPPVDELLWPDGLVCDDADPS